MIIARLTAAGYEELSRAKLIEPTKEQLNRGGEGVTWAYSSFADRHDKELI